MASPILTPMTIAEERDLAMFMLNFFDLIATHRRRKADGQTGTIYPSSLGDALRALPAVDEFQLVHRNPLLLATMAQRLTTAGLLFHTGSGKGSPPLCYQYFAFPALTAQQSRGSAWLTVVLGWNHLLHVVGPLVCQIVGTNRHGSETGGSGLLLDRHHAVTNQHVVEDMTPKVVWVRDRSYPVHQVLPHQHYDVAIVCLAREAPYADAGLAFRDHQSVEPILIAGYPPVPHAQSYGLTAQTGETCGATMKDFKGRQHLLFSAISRPGNSGGPVFGRDGRVVGLVSRAFERKAEDGEANPPLPFFAAVPAGDVRMAVRELANTLSFPWETWHQPGEVLSSDTA